jgi:hypothetical protein
MKAAKWFPRCQSIMKAEAQDAALESIVNCQFAKLHICGHEERALAYDGLVANPGNLGPRSLPNQASLILIDNVKKLQNMERQLLEVKRVQHAKGPSSEKKTLCFKLKEQLVQFKLGALLGGYISGQSLG